MIEKGKDTICFTCKKICVKYNKNTGFYSLLTTSDDFEGKQYCFRCNPKYLQRAKEEADEQQRQEDIKAEQEAADYLGGVRD